MLQQKMVHETDLSAYLNPPKTLVVASFRGS